ncbi:MAG: hypothetical protein B6229_02030 [Spirochaetaceae bacterium 4572_7]|nr:MAG: hypothetical protein B6229_02030 [Spirochaetaceae bacterium 4572_7]
MEKKSNNQNNLKKITTQFRELVDKGTLLSKKDVTELYKRYEITEEQKEKLETMASNNFQEATTLFSYGEWDKASASIEEAIYKSPINTDYLKLYYDILKEKYSLLDNNDAVDILDIILKRINLLDKQIYKSIIKKNKIKKNRVKKTSRKISKLWFLTLLLLVIPALLLIKESIEPIQYKALNSPKSPNNKGPKVIPVELYRNSLSRDIELSVKKSLLERYSNSYVYTLYFYMFSELNNTTSITGNITWLDKNGNTIFSEHLEKKDNIEYYINELIPFSYIKNSHSESPDLDSIVITITDIIQSKGKERTPLTPIDTIYNIHSKEVIELNEASISITKGIVNNYLTLTLLINNISRNTIISNLHGTIEWYDDFNIIQFSGELDLIEDSDVPLEPKATRLIRRVIELNGDITQTYKIILSEKK